VEDILVVETGWRGLLILRRRVKVKDGGRSGLGFSTDERALVVAVRWSKNAVDAAAVVVPIPVEIINAVDSLACWEDDRRNARRQDLDTCISFNDSYTTCCWLLLSNIFFRTI